jgi:hypothetical protein
MPKEMRLAEMDTDALKVINFEIFRLAGKNGAQKIAMKVTCFTSDNRFSY